MLLVVAEEMRHRPPLEERQGSEFFSTYGRRYGDDTGEIIDYHLREQVTFLEVVQQIASKSLILDSSSEGAVERARRFLEE